MGEEFSVISPMTVSEGEAETRDKTRSMFSPLLFHSLLAIKDFLRMTWLVIIPGLRGLHGLGWLIISSQGESSNQVWVGFGCPDGMEPGFLDGRE